MLVVSCSVKEKLNTSIRKATYYDVKSITITDKLNKNGTEIYTASSNISTMYKFNINEYMKRELSRDIIKKIAKECNTYHYKYFAILTPKEVSNLDGRIVNSINDFIENFNEYNMKSKRKLEGGWNIYSATMEISFIMLKEKPLDFVVWDARKIIKN